MTIFAICFLLWMIVGVGVLASNPHRPLNRAFFAFSLLTLAWLATLGALLSGRLANPVPALRLFRAELPAPFPENALHRRPSWQYAPPPQMESVALARLSFGYGAATLAPSRW